MRYCLSSIAGCKNPPVSILAIVKARSMSDCFSGTRPPCLAMIAGVLKSRNKLLLLNMRLGITSTIYAFIASPKVVSAVFIHSRECLSWYLKTKIAVLTTS